MLALGLAAFQPGEVAWAKHGRRGPPEPLPSMPEPVTLGLLAVSAAGVGFGAWVKGKRSGRGEGDRE